jgi:hypothetical protein
MQRGLAAAAFFAAVAAALLFPLFPHFASSFPHDAGDPVLNSWILWHESRHLPLTEAWWNGPIFFPAANTLALSEVLLSLLPLSAVTQALTHNPVAAYNVVFVATFPLCGLAMYLLACDLTGRVDAGLAAGVAFMLAPYRAEQLAHVQVLAYFWTPLVLLGLHRYVRDGRRRWLVLFAGAWLGQSLANGYAMFHVSILVLLWMVWFVRPLQRWLPILAAWAIAALPLAPILLRYEVVHSALHLTRDINEVRRFGIDVADFLAAPPDLLVWGSRLGLPRPETAVFPGATVILLGLMALTVARPAPADGEPTDTRWRRALIGVSAVAALVAFSVFVVGPWRVGPLSVRDFHKPFSIAVAARLLAFLAGPWTRRMWRARSIAGFYVLAAAAMYVLALGPEPRLLGRPMLYEPPYAWLMRLPGFETLRVPARFAMLAVLCQSALVAMAVSRWANGRRRVVVVTAIIAGLALDGWFRLPVAAAPEPGVQPGREVAAVVELPVGEPQTDFAAMFRQMQHGKPTVNGFSGYLPPHYIPLERTLRAGHYEVLYEISPSAPLLVTLDRRRADAAAIEAALVSAGIGVRQQQDSWSTFIVSPRPRPELESHGTPLRIERITASRHPEDVARMVDQDITTAWGTELGQTGGEEVVVELDASHALGALVVDMGAFAFGHPAGLEVDVSDDGAAWTAAWRGDPGVLAVRGALAQPGRAPIVLDLQAARGRYLRLRQTGEEPTIPWWIAELQVRESIIDNR